MDFFPIFMDLEGRDCLVVGGGSVAARKTRLLVRASARVKVVSPLLCDTLQKQLDAGEIAYSRRNFEDVDIAGKVLVIACTDQQAVNQRVSGLAKQQNIPVNVADQPELCGFIVPSIIDRSPVQVAVSTGGHSPVLARLLRARLESYVPAAYGRLAKLVESFRDQVKERFSRVEQRRQFWENALQGEVAELLFAGRDDIARNQLQSALDNSEDNPHPVGEVYLVGSGPGDPDLLTFRAIRLLQMADVVVYDRLVATILELAASEIVEIFIPESMMISAACAASISRIFRFQSPIAEILLLSSPFRLSLSDQ